MDEVVVSKTVLSNFRPKQANKWIGDPRVSIIELFIAILTGLNRPISLVFHPLTPPVHDEFLKELFSKERPIPGFLIDFFNVIYCIQWQ